MKTYHRMCLAFVLGGAACAGLAYGQDQVLPADPQPSAWFGGSVAISGDTLVVGSIQADSQGGTPQGAAYVFVNQGGTFMQQQKLSGDAGTAPQFGYAVAIDGNTLVVGARFANATIDGNIVRSGAAYVFTRSGTTWSPQGPKLFPSDGAGDDWFGSSVAISGDTIIVGAPKEEDTDSNLNRGAAYVFTRTGTTWTQQQKLNASDAQATSDFGASVGVSGDAIIVGAPNHSPAAAALAGAIYFFNRSGGVWTEANRINGSVARDGLGTGVAIDGTHALAGAPGFDQGTAFNAGAALAYQQQGDGTWTQVATLTASDAQTADGLGNAVAIDGTSAIAGAQGKANTRGAAYIYEGSGANWTQTKKAAVAFTAPDQYFGRSVGVSGVTAVVGAQFVDLPPATPPDVDQGAAFVFQPAQIPDADGDSISDAVDICPNVADPAQNDTDGDGQGDACDADDDNDGTPDAQDGCPLSAIKTAPGQCGCFVPESDSDCDGISDCIDPAADGNCNPATDTDGDGTPDAQDGCPQDPAKTSPGQCGCAVADTDSDGDGTADCLDPSDSDGDGTPDNQDGCPANPAKTSPGQCGCAVADTDSDGDGTADCLDPSDSDGDGTPDNQDGCAADPAKTTPGQCGCGVAETDTDGDGTPDCIDTNGEQPPPQNPTPCGCAGQAAVVSTLGLLCVGLVSRRRRGL